MPITRDGAAARAQHHARSAALDQQRGRTQTTAYLTRTIGQIAAVAVVGIGMNGKQYNGSFDWGLSFTQVMVVLAVPAAIMVPISWFGIEGTPKPGMGLSPYLQLCGALLRPASGRRLGHSLRLKR